MTPLIEPTRTREQWRRELRRRRRSLPAAYRQHSARRVAAAVADSAWLLRAPTIALYTAVGSELSTEPLMQLLLTRRCQVYLPRIVNFRHGQMRFVRYRPVDQGRHNRHGIPEPVAVAGLAPRWLSVIFVPLVGFDASGTRLGAGGGYYDRALRHHSGPRPLLVGLAFSCQQVDHLHREPHDVPMDLIITEHGPITCTTGF